MDAPSPAADARQLRSSDAGHEVWSLELVDPAAGVVASMGIQLGGGAAGWWTVIARTERPLVAVIDPEVSAPLWPDLEVRASGLWAELRVQTRLTHLTADLEAFGIEVDTPAELLGDARGHRVPVGSDVEWHATGVIVGLDDGYEVGAVVEGELLIGSERVAIAGTGWWTHRWGTAAWPRLDRLLAVESTSAGEIVRPRFPASPPPG
ncbi:MAG: hypothetical protein OEU32_01285 [Acidimicrobiia bacterium]|nr:hypothetical protein [Acidimicrobiia bacterium]